MEIKSYNSPKGKLAMSDWAKSLRDGLIVFIAATAPFALEQAELVEWGAAEPFATAVIAVFTFLANRKWNIARV